MNRRIAEKHLNGGLFCRAWNDTALFLSAEDTREQVKVPFFGACASFFGMNYVTIKWLFFSQMKMLENNFMYLLTVCFGIMMDHDVTMNFQYSSSTIS